MSAEPIPLRRAAELNINLVGAINRSLASEQIGALEHITAVHERLDVDHPAADYVHEHLPEDKAAQLIVVEPETFRFHCRQIQQFLDVGGAGTEFQSGGAV